MKFLRTAPTRLLMMIVAGAIVVVVAGTAIALAATSGGPVPQPASLADAIHSGLSAPKLAGITADVTFTNHLIDATNVQSDASDPLLQGGSGRLWYSPGSDRLRLELQSDNGDAQVVLTGGRFWISDPAAQTVYEGTLPQHAKTARSDAGTQHGSVPSAGSISAELTKLARQLTLNGSGSAPFAAVATDVGGEPAYSVQVSPKRDGGELSGVALAWDALHGVPLSIGIYAKGQAAPVLALQATNITFGAVPASIFAISPPSGDKVVKLGSVGSGTAAKHASARGGASHHHAITGVSAVGAALPFTLHAPASAAGLARASVAKIEMGGHPAALLTYGRGLSGVAVLESVAERRASGASAAGTGNLSLPTATLAGVTAHELPTPLGTFVTLQRAGIAYTVIGSLPRATVASAAAAIAGAA